MENRQIIGIDIGGTKIHIAAIQEGEIIKEAKFPTPAQSSKEKIIAGLISGIEPFISSETDGIGIGVPGLIDEEKGIVYDLNNIPAWQQVHLKKELEDHFHVPVYITNDANCFILGEKVYGKAKPYKNVVGLSIGTGLGGGIIINHQLYSGTLSSAGEIGGVPYLDKTLEDYCSGKFFLGVHGTEGTEILARAEAGDSQALEIFQEFGHHIGNAVKVILLILSPQAIFLGGSVCSAYPFFKEAMLKTIHTFPFKGVIKDLVIQPSDTKNGPLFGAAALFRMKNVTPGGNQNIVAH